MEKKLKRLKRVELMEIIYQLRIRLDKTTEERDRLRKELAGARHELEMKQENDELMDMMRSIMGRMENIEIKLAQQDTDEQKVAE